MERLDLSHARFSQAEVLQIVQKLSAKTLQNWKSRGIIDSGQDTPGKGHKRLYTGNGIVMLNFMSIVVDFGIPPANARKMADRVAMCANQLWQLKLDELRPSGMHQFTPPCASDNSTYRRGFIFAHGGDYFIVIGRKDRNGSLSQRFYSVAAVDLINIEALNQINRHIAGLPKQIYHVDDVLHTDDVDDLGVIERHEFILSQIKTLPVDLEEDYA